MTSRYSSTLIALSSGSSLSASVLQKFLIPPFVLRLLSLLQFQFLLVITLLFAWFPTLFDFLRTRGYYCKETRVAFCRLRLEYDDSENTYGRQESSTICEDVITASMILDILAVSFL